MPFYVMGFITVIACLFLACIAAAEAVRGCTPISDHDSAFCAVVCEHLSSTNCELP